MSYSEFVTMDARLVLLRELAGLPGGRINEVALTTVLDAFGYRRSRDWVRTQLRAMTEIGAVRVTEAGTVWVAEITRAGLDHVERRIVLEGVAKPSPPA